MIFICKFDPFGRNLYRYSFVNSCEEDPALKLDDGATRLFFNTKGEKGEISDHLRELLAYMNDTKAYPVEKTENDLIEKIEEAVGMARKSSEWRRSFMMYQERQRTIQLQGIEKARLKPKRTKETQSIRKKHVG